MVILYILLCFVVVILMRALVFTPKATAQREFEKVEVDEEHCVKALAELVKCKTVSRTEPELEDDAEFEKLIGKLPQLYPNVWASCPLTRLDGRALLFKWAGREAGEAAVLMAHYDVVPVEEENWLHPAFDALIEDGVMWGRGTLDTKVTFNGIMCAAEAMIKAGFQPKNDVYFAFSGGEEVNGPGAKNIVEYFRQNNVALKLVLDEGGAVVENVFPGVTKPCGLIGIAEKGLLNVEYSISGHGGHASAPAPHTPVGKLSAACARLENKPFKLHVTKPAAEMFDTLGRHSSFLYKIIFANLWCFKPVLDLICRKSGGEINALLRTTVAFTQMRGSPAPNVIPSAASMVSNLRLNPEDSVEGALSYIRSVIKDESISLRAFDATEPSPISRTDCEGWQIVADSVLGTWPGCIVSPYLMVQCSDSRHYGPISDRVYRFSAMALTKEERGTIHGANEGIRLENISKAVEFFTRVIKKL